MSEGIIRFDDARAYSIAEMNLLEQIADVVNTVEKEVARTDEMLSSLVEGKVELVKKAYELVRALKEEAQKKKESAMEFLVRASPNILHKEMYIFALIHLDALSQQVDELAYKLSLMASANAGGIPKEASSSIREVFGKVREMIKLLREEAKSLTTGGKDVALQHEKILALEDEVDYKQRELFAELLKKANDTVSLLVAKELLEALEGSSDRVREVSHVFKYIALLR